MCGPGDVWTQGRVGLGGLWTRDVWTRRRCGVWEVWTRGRVDLRRWTKGQCELWDMFDRGRGTSGIRMSACLLHRERSEYRIRSMQSVVYFVVSHG